MKSSSVYLLTAQDCELLDRYKLIVDAIGQVFGNSCECVLHSLADLEHSVIHIHNGMKTGRVLGSPVTDKALMLLKNCESLHQDITPVYQTVARNGSPMRSTTIIIRNNDRIPIGFYASILIWERHCQTSAIYYCRRTQKALWVMAKERAGWKDSLRKCLFRIWMTCCCP